MKKTAGINFNDESVKCTMSGWGFRFKVTAATYRTDQDKFSRWVKLFLERLPVERHTSIIEFNYGPDTVVRDKFITALKQQSELLNIDLEITKGRFQEFTFYKNKKVNLRL